MKAISASQKRALCIVLAAATMLVAPVPSALAQGQPSAEDMESARVLFNKGREARTAGDMSAALEHFKAAHALGRTPITGIELAKTHQALNQWVEARELCMSIQRLPVAPDETQRSDQARADAVKCAADSKAQLGELKLVFRVYDAGKVAKAAMLVPATDPMFAEVEVQIDGKKTPTAALSAVRQLNPGTHQVEAGFVGGEKNTQSVTITKGNLTELELSLMRPTPEERAKSGGNTGLGGGLEAPKRMSVLVPIGLTVASAGLVTMLVGGGMALSTQGDITRECSTERICPVAFPLAETKDRANTWATIGSVGLGVMLVGGVIALAGFLLPTSNKSTEGAQTARVKTRPQFAFTGTGVYGVFP
jgi:hypothetical protein